VVDFFHVVQAKLKRGGGGVVLWFMVVRCTVGKTFDKLAVGRRMVVIKYRTYIAVRVAGGMASTAWIIGKEWLN
jgi:hypothetical protein